MDKQKLKKIGNITRTIAVWLVVAVAIFMMIFTIVSVTTFDRNDRNVFGYKAFIVRTDSMAATDFAAGDIIFSKKVDDPSTLKEGDIITFQSQDENSFGEVITHKIRRVTTTADGLPGFVTYGTTTDVDDETVVTYSFVLGKYQGRIPKVGIFFNFLKTTAGYVCCILIPFLILIGLQGLNCIKLFRKYKAEQEAQMNAEREQLEKEREENRKMLEELQALKAQLENKENATGESPTEEK